MAKDNRKCVRLNCKAMAIIEECPGGNFSEQFENLVFLYKEQIPKLNERRDMLNKEIEQCENRLSELRLSIDKVEQFNRQVQYFMGIIDRMLT